MLSERAIEKYREIYRQRFGEDISREESIEQATKLLNAVRVMAQPIPKKVEGRYRQILQEETEATQKEQGHE